MLLSKGMITYNSSLVVKKKQNTFSFACNFPSSCNFTAIRAHKTFQIVLKFFKKADAKSGIFCCNNHRKPLEILEGLMHG